MVVTKGTTNEQAMHTIDKKFSLGLNIVTSPDHEQSYQMLVDGKADAFATDDILLYGLIARHKAQDKFKVTGEYLSYDPYGIMFRKGEPQLKAVVERTFRKLGSGRDLIPLYNKWFVGRLPTGEKLGVSISPQLEEAFKVLDGTAGGTTRTHDSIPPGRCAALVAGISTRSPRCVMRSRSERGCLGTQAADMTEVAQKNLKSCARPPRAAVAYSIAKKQSARDINSSLLAPLASSLASRTASSIVAATLNVRRGIGARAQRRRCLRHSRPCDGPPCR